MRAWLLNLDADFELGHPRTWPLPAKVIARTRAMASHMEPLWADADVVLDEDTRVDGLEARAWCPTARARERLQSAGARLVDAPSVDTVRRVNHRAFCGELGQTLPEATFVRDLDALHAALAAPDLGQGWLLKRPHSFAGTGQRKLWRLERGHLDWVAASLREDGLQVEPIVVPIVEFSTHGWVGADGAIVIGAPCEQRVAVGGVWSKTIIADLDDAILNTLRGEAHNVAAALHVAGYFGPFGVDAMQYSADKIEKALNPRSEINARYTMGWALGMGERRPDLL
jgi:hypothetical protein